MLTKNEQKRKRMNPLTDIAFKKVFENKKRLKSFISSILDYDVEVLSLSSNEQLPDIEGGKKGILDIKAITKTGEKINVEVQIVNQYNIEERSLYYLSKMYAEDFKAGQNYKEIKKSIAINILDFKRSNWSDDYQSEFLMMNKDTKEILTDKFQMHFIELPKFQECAKRLDLNDQLQRWLIFLKEDDKKLLKEVVNLDKNIESAEKELNYYALDEKSRRNYDNQMKQMSDYVTNIEGSREEGLNQGREQGAKEEKLKIAKKMKNNGYSNDEIKALTGIDPEILN